MKKLGYVAVAAMALMAMLVGGCGSDKKADTAASGNKLIVYTSMKENLIRGIVDGFKKANPGVEVDYQSAGELSAVRISP